MNYVISHLQMANLQRPNSTAEYIPAPTLFRSVFAGRPALGYPKDLPDAVPAKKEDADESDEDNHLDDAVEENKVNTEDGESEESNEDDSSNESRIKKSASSDESGSDESDEDESDEEDDDDDDEKPKRQPSRWRQTRYGSSYRIQAVGRPINYGYHHDSRDPETPRY